MTDQPRHGRQEPEPWPGYSQQPAGFQPQQPYAQYGQPQQPYPPQPYQGQYPQQGWQPQPEPKKKRRVFLWFFLAVQLLFIVWIIGGASTAAGQPKDCGVLDAATCNAASDAGTAIGVTLIIGIWLVADVLLGIIYGVYRLASRR